MPQQPTFVFYQFNSNRVVTGLTSPLPKVTKEMEVNHDKLRALLAISESPNYLKRKFNDDDTPPKKRIKTNSNHTGSDDGDGGDGGDGGDNDKKPMIQNKSNNKLSPLLRVDKVETMISVLNHEHMYDDQKCHDNFKVLVDIEINEEVSGKLKAKELELNMSIAKFLHFKQITDKKMPILSLEETKTLFARILESHLGNFTKQLDVTIKLECCGACHTLDKFSTQIPAKVIAKKVDNVKVPLLPLPPKDDKGKYIYSKIQIQDQLKAIYNNL